MLLSYTFSNFQSFPGETFVDLTLGAKAPVRGWERLSPSGQRTTTALGVFGANGAGKTALLKPLVFVAWFMQQSFARTPESKIPLISHFQSKEPTKIEVVADDLAGTVWKYVLHADENKVIYEALFRKGSRYSYVFKRALTDDGVSYDIQQQGFGFAAAEAKKVRPNASLIATAAQYGVEIATHVSAFLLTSNVRVTGRAPYGADNVEVASELFGNDEGLRNKMAALITQWDLGLSSINVEEIEYNDSNGDPQTFWTAFGVHKLKNGQIRKLHFPAESSGTQSVYWLLSRLLTALESGGIAVIDEIEADLHSNLLEPIIELFDAPKMNTHGAQLLFACHSFKALELLQKAQVYFVEKIDCESMAFRGDDIAGLRSDDNLRAKYESGAIGAIPNI